MNILIIEQDLRVSGSSQGIISRSFLSKLRISYPDSKIDVVYFKTSDRDDRLDLLPVNEIKTHILKIKVPFFTKFVNRFYWRLFHVSLNQLYINKVYNSYITNIKHEEYDHIFIRSAGLNYETILASRNLPILKKAIINFHEPYPDFWCAGATKKLSSLDLFKIKEMLDVVEQAKSCMATDFLAKDLEFLYGSRKPFYKMPHQYCDKVFDFSDKSMAFKKEKNVTISYHGALQFGRNIDILLDIYKVLLKKYPYLAKETEFVLRLKSSEFNRIKNKYLDTKNIRVLEGVNFSNSAYEQKFLTDINIILENGPVYCSVLLGKIPLIASIDKPFFSLSPQNSEMNTIVKNKDYVASYENSKEIEIKFKNCLDHVINNVEFINPFGNYFSDEAFKKRVDEIIKN